MQRRKTSRNIFVQVGFVRHKEFVVYCIQMELESFEVVVCETKGKLGKPLVDTEELENLSNITQPIPRATIGRGIELVARLLGDESSCHC